jgi:hypothetical protein
MADMDYHSTVHFSFETDKDALWRLEIVRDFVLQETNIYSFQLLINNQVVDGPDSEKPFNDLIEFVGKSKTDEDGWYNFEDFGSYESGNRPDLEEGQLAFEKSFVLERDRIHIYLNMSNFFASEIESFESRGSGIYAEMNDYDGGYYEFEF